MSGRIAIRNPWKTSIGAEAIDLFTPEIDLPSPSDIPGALVSVSAGTWRAIRELIDIPLDVLGNFGFSIPGLGGGGLVVETDPMSPYGPIVKRWTAGVTPFVLTQFGWIGARKKSGVWSWYKPKKPLVVVPGHPPDARTARKLATIWKRERKQAKKIFDLVDRGGTTRRRAPQTINIEAGPGSIHS
jgi:predicted RNA binding protein YcfA (HicA-like mRNA interferase family)